MGWRVFSRRMVPVGNRVVIVLGAGYRGVGVSGIGVSRYRGDSRCWGIGVLGYWGIGVLGYRGIGYRVSGIGYWGVSEVRFQ